MKIKKNDNVVVIAGKDKGKTGKVAQVFPKKGTVAVSGVNVQKKHKKPRSAQDVGGIIDQVGAIDVSNVQIICDACKKATRVAMKEIDGKKVRVCKKCGATLDTAKPVKEVKATKEAKTDVAEKAEKKEPAKRKPRTTTAKTAEKKAADAE